MFSMLFDNAGRKIQTVAKVFFCLGVLVSVFTWIICMILGAAENDTSLMFFSIGALFIGVFVSWLSNLLLYGFGTLIANSKKIVENTKGADERFNFGSMD